MSKANRGEWGEPYAAIRILGEGRLYVADSDGKRNLEEWMDIIDLIRRETAERTVKYEFKKDELMISIAVNEKSVLDVAASEFIAFADRLAAEIRLGKGSTFNVSSNITDFLKRIEMLHIKAKSIDKSDVFLTIHDPRASVIRKSIGFSIKSEF